MNLDDVDRWIAGYVRAWTSNDSGDIGALFTDDAQYRTEPYADPWVGRDEIVRQWLESKDEPGTWAFRSEPLALAGDVAFVRGWADYTDGEPRRYHNLWVIRLADGGRASEFTEWFMKQR